MAFVPPALRRRPNGAPPSVEAEEPNPTIGADRHATPGPSPVALRNRFGQQGARMRAQNEVRRGRRGRVA